MAKFGGASTPPPAPAPSIMDRIGGAAKAVGSFLTGNEQGFGNEMAASIGAPAAQTQADTLNAQHQATIHSAIALSQSLKAAGKDSSKTDAFIQEMQGQAPHQVSDVLPAVNDTNGQVLGNAGGVALDTLTAGTLAKGAKSFGLVKSATAAAEKATPTLASSIVGNIESKAPTTAQRLADAGKSYLKSAATYGGIGYGYDVANNLQQGKTGTDAVKPGAGTAIGAVLPGLPAAAKVAGVISKDAAPKIVNSLVKPLLKDFAYGKNPGRVIAEEGITGNNFDQLAKNIATRRGQIGEEIGSLTKQIDAQTGMGATAAGKPGKVLQLGDSLKPIDTAMKDAASTNNATLLSRLQQVKDALVHNLSLGTDKAGNPSIVKGEARNLNAAGFADAFDLKKMVGNMTRWTGNKSDDEAVNAALKQVYGQVHEKMDVAAQQLDPKAAARLTALNAKYADLTTAEVATKYRDKIEARQNLISAPMKAGAIAGVIAAPFTGGVSLTTGLVALGAAGLDKALGSVAVKTRVAAWLAKESPTVLDKFFAQHPQIASVIDNTFSKEMSLPNDQRGMIKNPFANATELHPEDRSLLNNYIDAVRLRGKPDAPALSERDYSSVESIFQKLGISLDQSEAGLAKQAELILNGQQDASALYRTGRKFKNE